MRWNSVKITKLLASLHAFSNSWKSLVVEICRNHLPKCTDLDQAVQNHRMAQGIIDLRHSFYAPNAGDAENIPLPLGFFVVGAAWLTLLTFKSPVIRRQYASDTYRLPFQSQCQDPHNIPFQSGGLILNLGRHGRNLASQSLGTTPPAQTYLAGIHWKTEPVEGLIYVTASSLSFWLALNICIAQCKISFSALGTPNYMHFQSANIMHFWKYCWGTPCA